MKGFETIIPDRIFKKLKKIPKDMQKEILNKIESISKTPELLDVVKMGGYEDTYRLRIGKYRVIFLVDFKSKLIKIDKLGVRGRIY